MFLGMSYETNSQGLPEEKIAAVSQNLGSLGRYMEDDINGGCQKVTLSSWDEIQLIKCTYKQKDKIAGYKTATVIMLNPKKAVLAKWIVASCAIVLGLPDENTNYAFDKCTKKLQRRIVGASSAQFPIAGIVLEDQYPESKPDGIQEVYTFRDGLTVEVEGGLAAAFTGNFGKNENAIALDTERKITKAKRFARLQSTTREEYKLYMRGDAKEVTGTKWIGVIRDLYKAAWQRAHNDSLPETIEKYRNDLMVAACYSVVGKKPPEK
jgi:hypothetical protein